MIKKCEKKGKKLVFKKYLGNFVVRNVLSITTLILFLWQTDIF